MSSCRDRKKPALGDEEEEKRTSQKAELHHKDHVITHLHQRWYGRARARETQREPSSTSSEKRCVCVGGLLLGGAWEITHYLIVLVFGGKALFKFPLRPSHLSSSLSNSLLHHFLPLLRPPSASDSFLHIPPHLNLPLLFSFSPPLCLSLRLSDRKQLGSQTMEHIKNHHQPHQLHSHTHTQTQQDKQDIPAAGCTGFLASAKLKRRVTTSWREMERRAFDSTLFSGSVTEIPDLMSDYLHPLCPPAVTFTDCCCRGILRRSNTESISVNKDDIGNNVKVVILERTQL